MAQGRSDYTRLHSSTTSSPTNRKKSHIRRTPPSRKRLNSNHSSSTESSYSTLSLDTRPVLVALHQNLRRLPSRLQVPQKENMYDTRRGRPAEQVGMKRKRVASTNENSHYGNRSTRGNGRLKRLRSTSGSTMDYSSDSSGSSSMDVDTRWSTDEVAEEPEQSQDVEEEQSDNSEEDESSDDYLINSAAAPQLLRMRKDELLRLYTLAGLSDDTDTLTKPQIVECLISARDDLASLPPSSPPGRGTNSDCSSDEGNFADEDDMTQETPRASFAMRRRATTNDTFFSNGRPLQGRSFSLGHARDNHELEVAFANNVKRNNERSSPSSGSHTRRRTSSRSSSSTSSAPLSPPGIRLRTRKLSATGEGTSANSSTSQPACLKSGKGKQVEFANTIKLPKGVSSPKQSNVGASSSAYTLDDESDLTELDESEGTAQTANLGEPSPRRLRSKDKQSSKPVLSEDRAEARRSASARMAKSKVQTLEEEQSSEDEAGSDDEVDQLASSASSPSSSLRGDRSPMKRRLRPRRDESTASASDGDDEDDESVSEADDSEQDAEEVEADMQSVMDDDDDEVTIAVEPRRLRNGKIVGEEETLMELDEGDEEGDEEDPEEDEGIDVSDDQVTESDDDGAAEEEGGLEEDVDLTIATAKTLVRLRRDDLVRLCETRDLEPIGTKPQLAEALLQWRDQQSASSPSSTGTVRPPSTARRTRKRSSQQTPPVLLRSEHFHQDTPRTPPVSGRKGGAEPEIELDLGTLGLEDREIPPEKLQKLEKIGSGGFKDVFVGKFRGRKVALAEFRGQLSAMDIKELKLLGGFDHPNIVRFLGVSIPENTRETPVMIVTELCANGDLFDYIRNVNAPSLHKVLSIMLDIARGVDYLHRCKPSIIHRDCKSSNILITSKGAAKIADFGLAKVKQSTRSMVRSLVGTVNWQAPELWHAHPKYNHKVDVFSCACVFWEMLQWHIPNKKFPWEGMNEHAIYDIVGAKRQRPSLAGLRKQWSPEIVELIEQMWAHEHQDRPTMLEVVNTLEDLVSRR